MSEGELFEGRFEVLRTVSEGPRARVLQGIDRLHDRLVALKVYPVHADDTEGLLSEARMLMSLAPHPSLPVVRGDFFTSDRSQYVIVMNWVDGKDLQEVLDEDGDPGLPLQEVIDDLTQAADALDWLHAHEPPIIHGDVKPANLLRASSGRVVLVDFDIAGAGHGRIGTTGYVAPEVTAGVKPEAAADIYGLAATIVTLLRGHPPRAGGADQDRLPRALRNALSTDPAKRPTSAAKLVRHLVSASGSDRSSDIVALLSLQAADVRQLPGVQPGDVRSAFLRLTDLRDSVVDAHGGQVVEAMTDLEHMTAIFREATSAALAGLELQDRVDVEAFPPGVAVHVSAAITVGEATLVDGRYVGTAVEHVERLRSISSPGSTITSEATAEMLVDLVGHSLSLVPIGEAALSTLRSSTRVFALTRPGAEHLTTPLRRTEQIPDVGPQPVSRSTASSASRASSMSWSGAALEALDHSLTLAALLVVGLGVIYRVVLVDEFDVDRPVAVLTVVSAVVFAVSFGRRFIRSTSTQRARVDAEMLARTVEQQARELAEERRDARRQLELGFAGVRTEHLATAIRVLRTLGDELESIELLLSRRGEELNDALSSMLPPLIEDTYRCGISALSDALEVLKSADRLNRHRLEQPPAGFPDVQRQASNRAEHLIQESERCADALSEAHVELISVRGGDISGDVESTVQTLQLTIRSVRELQEEFRKLG